MILDSDSRLRGSVHAEHRRRFSPQFKAEAMQMVIETGKPIAEVARDLGIHDGTLQLGERLAPRASRAASLVPHGACAREGTRR
jgi:transposase-like protein